MSKLLEKNIEFLNSLSHCKCSKRRELLQNASRDNIKALCEVCLNLLLGNIQVNAEQIKKLRRHRKSIEALADRKLALKRKKEVLNQRGGALGAAVIAATLLPTLYKTIKNAVQKRKKKK